MILYHGTNESFTDVDLKKSRIGKDFGIGFYLTPSFEIARRQAQRKFVQYGTGDVQVYSFDFNDKEADKLKVLHFGCQEYTMEWADFIMLNRSNKTNAQAHDYDVVIGPIADDAVGYQIQRLEDGIITRKQFLEMIKFNFITIQYLFATEKSLTFLKRL